MQDKIVPESIMYFEDKDIVWRQRLQATACICSVEDVTAIVLYDLNISSSVDVWSALCDDVVSKVMCWGVRSMRKFQLSNVVSPSVEIEIGGQVVRSKVIKNAARNPNFDDPVLFFDIVSIFHIFNFSCLFYIYLCVR